MTLGCTSAIHASMIAFGLHYARSLQRLKSSKKKHFYHIINNMAQRYEYQDIDGHVILLFVHPAPFFVMSGDTPPHGRGSLAPSHSASIPSGQARIRLSKQGRHEQTAYETFLLANNFRQSSQEIAEQKQRGRRDKKKNDSQSSLEVIFCTPSGARTLDPLIKSQLLYQLS